MAPAVTRSTFPHTVTGTTWGGALASVRSRAEQRRGQYDSHTDAPKLTNGDAIALVRAWSGARGRNMWPLWYQFAAVAYGWDPTRDTLDTSAAQQSRTFPRDASVMLWSSLDGLAAELDASGDNTAALYFDDNTWGDPLFASDVRRALVGDGASAAFKIPLPACKDPKTGKPVGRPRKGPDGKWRCDPVVVDDPITHLDNQLTTAAVVILLVWLVVRDSKPRRHRRN